MNSEPAITIIGSITGLIAAGWILLTAFGASISSDQKDAIIGFVIALYVLGGIVIRSRVFAKDTVETLVEDAHFAGTIGKPKAKV